MSLSNYLAKEIDSEWDVVIIGAGPAGAFAAYQLAQKKRKVLLVDKSSFPRFKVCGSCLNSEALRELKKAGLLEVVLSAGAVPLHEFKMASGKSETHFSLKNSFVLSREKLDQVLIDQAVLEGATFLDETKATVLGLENERRFVFLESRNETKEIFSRVVLVSDGLAGTSLTHLSEVKKKKSSASKIGLGALLENPNPFYEPSVVYMAHSEEGYVGLVRLQNGLLDVAAALNPKALKQYENPAQLIQKILAKTSWPKLEKLEEVHFQGTPLLTQKSSRLALQRVFIIGDAASYIEPFTGEGMAWAFCSAQLVIPWVEASLKGRRLPLEKGWGWAYFWHFWLKKLVLSGIAKGLRFGPLVSIILTFLRYFRVAPREKIPSKRGYYESFKR